MSHSHDPFRPSNPSGPAPIVWTSLDSPTSPHPWAGPDPFAQPDPPAPAPPVTESHVEPAEPVIQQFPAPVARAEPAQEQRRDPWQEQPSQEAAVAQQPVQEAPQDAPQDDDALTIGRGRGNSIVLDDMLVSRNHVRITADDDGLVLQDLGSRNGTYVNNDRVQRTSLHEGDRIGIGATTFEVRDGWLVSI